MIQSLLKHDIKDVISRVNCKTTHIVSGKETPSLIDIMKEEEFQLIKQQWSTTSDVENFWYIDTSHILQLDNSNFTILEKVDDSYDDWNGNKWTVLSHKQRGNYITSAVLKYMMSNNEPKFITFSTDNNNIVATMYDPITFAPSKFVVPVVQQQLGNAVNTKSAISTYLNLTAKTLISNAKISAVTINGTTYIGIAYDRGLNQWLINTATGNVLCGYGHIGFNGEVTGGEIPTQYFDVNNGGFTGVVQPISALENWKSNNKLTGWQDIIVGTETQQWYITKNINRIVSHLQHVDGVFYATSIPISSCYADKYASTSFATDCIDQIYPMPMLLSNFIPMTSSIKSIVGVLEKIFMPSLWYYAPTWTKFSYLQQSVGQYAYVWHNNTSLPQKATANEDSMADAASGEVNILKSDELTFDKIEYEQSIRQDVSYFNSAIGGFLITLLTQGISALGNTTAQLLVNSNEGTTTADTQDKKYAQYFTANLMSTTTTDTMMHGFNAKMSSKVTKLKSLDMFYSTSSSAKCAAGPGFVNHNFVADCIAQSTSNRYIQANQNMMFSILVPLSVIELKARNILLEEAQKRLESVQTVLCSVTGVIASAAAAAAAAAVLIASEATKVIVAANNFFIEYLPKVMDCFKIGQGASFSQLGAISEHRISIEGKHKYGNKNVSLFWPCYGQIKATMTNEKVVASIEDVTTEIDFSTKNFSDPFSRLRSKVIFPIAKITNVTSNANNDFCDSLNGNLHTELVYCKGESEKVALPADMAVIEGVTTFLPVTNFKNENISVGDPVFTTPAVQDYVLDKKFQIGITAIDGEVLWVSCKDTKLFDGMYSNCIKTDNSFLIACPYGAFEIKNTLDINYTRPYAVTPNTIAINSTGINCIHDNKAYHAFDGVGQRIVEWHGSSGLDKQHLAWQYCFQVNDHFKRSNILPANQFLGNFASPPVVAVNSRDKVHNSFQLIDDNNAIMNTIAGENKNVPRYAIPVFSDQISTLPAVIKTLSSYKLHVIEGITSLTTDIRTTQSGYKAPDSVDFAINGITYRATDEFVCTLNSMSGITSVKDIVATMGLKYIGATTTQAFFYSPATRAYYMFTGAEALGKIDVWNRFKDINQGQWDFVNQEVVFKCIADLSRLEGEGTDEVMICRLDSIGVSGEVTPPNKTIYKDDFKILSMPGGLCYQGPKRFIVNRFVYLDSMLDNILDNIGKWKRLNRETFDPFREYKDINGNVTVYEAFNDTHDSRSIDHIPYAVNGWTYNPFVFVTSPMGISEDTDCMFEWEVTFTWTNEMDKIYAGKKYMCINIAAQTMAPGGKLTTRPTHLMLTKEMFTRGDNSGYYSFRFNSNNGAGNREQLFIWSDSYIALCSVQLEYKPVTSKRNTILTQQVDVTDYEEL